ncbi:Hypothetical protein DEACI_3845 [Acididesulfobacillus acetoxydans]|uniref:Uncharacterized protein n=1 Tax=Acididesulfobacillus acetoxydans TaxID=1561005 RepID=A0A8S0WHZ6_9FIRM|nr:Hypothetical protein DEACI_3845 [Acididesulfobacillus acetoxydans]CEJ08981.1 Hypothetical protein DEACI_3463 [Acididesulfobacillus acetoxydans]
MRKRQTRGCRRSLPGILVNEGRMPEQDPKRMDRNENRDDEAERMVGWRGSECHGIVDADGSLKAEGRSGNARNRGFARNRDRRGAGA